MNGVVIVAPVDARWPVRAGSVLADARMFTARLYELQLLPLLLRSGGVGAVAIDARAAERTPGLLRECAAVDRRMRIVIVHEDGEPTTIEGRRSQPWPEAPAAMLALVSPA